MAMRFISRCLWVTWPAVLAASLLLACQEDVDSPPVEPPAQVMKVERFIGGSVGGTLVWGEEIHVTFDHDPGPVRIGYGSGPYGPNLLGTGTLRGFLARSEMMTLTWGDGESYVLELERLAGDDSGPNQVDVVPDLYDEVVSAEDLAAQGIVVTFDAPISPPVEGADRLYQLWAVTFVTVTEVATGARLQVVHTVHENVMTILPAEGEAFAPGTDYNLSAVVTDTLIGLAATAVSIDFTTE